jgi:hypothetical protein
MHCRLSNTEYLLKSAFLFGVLGVFYALSGCSDMQSEHRGTYLIRVGESVVTVLDFNTAFEIAKMAYPQVSEQNRAVFREARLRLLDQMIEEMIVLERARTLNIQIPDDELEKAVADIKSDYPEGVFEEMLLENAVSFKYWKKRLKSRLLMEKVISKELSEKIRITPEAVSAYYDEFLKGHSGDPVSAENSKNMERMVVDHLKWKKTEEAYSVLIEKYKKEQNIQINEKQWKAIIDS